MVRWDATVDPGDDNTPATILGGSGGASVQRLAKGDYCVSWPTDFTAAPRAVASVVNPLGNPAFVYVLNQTNGTAFRCGYGSVEVKTFLSDIDNSALTFYQPWDFEFSVFVDDFSAIQVP
jgi:hypothetical protein